MDFRSRIFVSLTSTNIRREKEHWRKQLEEIKQLNLKQIGLFPCTLNPSERQEMYQELENSPIEEIKLVHLRDEDFTERELDYFYHRFKTRVFNCHPESLDKLFRQFPQFRKNIAVEYRAENKLSHKVEPNRMGGFCLDLAHFKIAAVNQFLEADYVLKHLAETKVSANHLGGYSYRKKKDLHFVTNAHQFDYLLDLPSELFGPIICFELENSIARQLKFREYVAKLISRKFDD